MVDLIQLRHLLSKIDSVTTFVVLPQGWSCCELLSFATFGCGGVLLFGSKRAVQLEKRTIIHHSELSQKQPAGWAIMGNHDLEVDPQH
jgi:hypothetical protein